MLPGTQIPLKCQATEDTAEALVNIYSRIEIPEVIPSDMATSSHQNA